MSSYLPKGCTKSNYYYISRELKGSPGKFKGSFQIWSAMSEIVLVSVVLCKERCFVNGWGPYFTSSFKSPLSIGTWLIDPFYSVVNGYVPFTFSMTGS